MSGTNNKACIKKITLNQWNYHQSLNIMTLHPKSVELSKMLAYNDASR